MTDQKNKPVLDEQAFDKLLQAAHVLQEHNRKMRELEERMESHSQRLREQEAADQAPLQEYDPKEEAARPGDYTVTLAEIVEAQRQIQALHLALDKAMAVVAEKVARITNAGGAAIGILEGKTVHYLAGFGAPALPLGSEVPLATAICAASVRTGQVIRSEDVNTEVLFDPEPCRQRGILSLVAVPIYHDGDIVGALELYFDRIQGFAEQDIHTCQLLAGLVTEAIGRDARLTLKKSMAAGTNVAARTIPASEYSCWKCGGKRMAEEQFCGKCGAPRVSDGEPSSMQSKLASAWHTQPTSQEALAAASANQTPASDLIAKDSLSEDSLSKETTHPVAADSQDQDQESEAALLAVQAADNLPAALSPPELQEEEHEAETEPLAAQSSTAGAHEDATAVSVMAESQLEPDLGEDRVETPSSVLAPPQNDNLVWTSAAKTRDFLESLAGKRTPGALVLFWRSRRGDFYLAVALILVVAVIRWGIWSNHSVTATDRGTAVSSSANRHPQPAPDANLSTFDKLLIGLGLAEAPEPPEYKGNPDTQVWVDLHTALYYCPGSDLYGKTPKGKLTSQRDAQLDHFEPANRKPCD